MDKETADILARVTAAFYRRHAASFSSTRHGAWRGWERLLAGPAGAVFSPGHAGSAPLPGWPGFAGAALRDGSPSSTGSRPAPPVPGAPRVLDVACGNLRFERFLREASPGISPHVDAVDNCPPLAAAGGGLPPGVSFREADVIGALLRGKAEDALPAGPYGLVACFGFLHHVPGRANRARLLRVLAGLVAPGGCLAVSFWQFGNSPELLARAREAHARGIAALAPAGLDPARLEEGDFLLGWQDDPDAFRYCHCFDALQVDALLQEAGLQRQVADRFEADGRTGDLNAYIVLRA